MANCNYKVNIKDIQSKYSFKIFCAGDNAEVQAEIGNLEDLTTTAKNNLVSAINEVHSDTETNATAISGLQSSKEDKSNKVTSFSSTSTDTQYPSAKAVYDSQVTQDETISTLETNLEETQAELDYYKTIYNVLPKVNGNGESITLNDTGESILKLDPRGQVKQDSTTGKNLLPLPINDTTTVNGITYTVDRKKGTITANGTATATANLVLLNPYNTNGETWFVSGCPSGGGNSTYTIYTQDSNDNGNGTGVNTSNGYIGVRVYQGYTANNVVFYPMLEKGSSKTDFEPYTGGIPAPNPSYPYPIHEVSGDNEIQVDRNVLTTLVNNYGINSTYGTITETAGRYCEYGEIEEEKKYTIARDSVGDSSYYYYAFYSQEPTPNITPTSNSFASMGNSTLEYTTPIAPTGAKYLAVFYGAGLSKGGIANEGTYIDRDTYELDLGVENLLNVNNSEIGGIDSSGNLVPSTTNLWRANVFIEVQPNTTYTLSRKNFDDSVSRTIRLYEYNSSQIFISPRQESTTNKLTITTTANTKYLKWTITEANATFTLDIVKTWKLQLEEGSKANSYSPFGQTPIKMRGIGTYEDYFVRNSGKNLYNKNGDFNYPTNSYVDGTTLLANGTIQTTANAQANASRGIRLTLKQNTDYVVSGRLISSTGTGTSNIARVRAMGYGTTWTELGGKALSSTGNFAFSFNTGTTTDWFISLNANGSSGGSYVAIYDKIMVNEGTTQIGYEPYGTGQWCKYNAIGNVVLDGTEDNWEASGGATNLFQNTSIFNGKYLVQNAYCNYYNNVVDTSIVDNNSADTILGNGQFSFRMGSSKDRIYIKDTRYTTWSDLQTWLSTHNITVDYVLSQPYLELITNNTLKSQLDKVEKALAKSGQTNISQVNNDIPFKIYASALKEIE